jgi:hypothetical protein
MSAKIIAIPELAGIKASSSIKGEIAPKYDLNAICRCAGIIQG